MLTSIPVLDDGECKDLCQAVAALRPFWVARTAEPAAFFTLGVACYQDLPPPVPGVRQRDYYREAPAYNALIGERFPLDCWSGCGACCKRPVPPWVRPGSCVARLPYFRIWGRFRGPTSPRSISTCNTR